MSTPDEDELCYPHLGNSSCRRIVFSHSVSVLIHILLSSLSVLTFILNLLVIITVSHFKKLHTPTNFLLLSLAVSDFSVGFIWIFRTLLLDGCWFINAGWCVFNPVVTGILSSASLGTVVLISVDRYVAVCDPMHYSTKVTLNRAKTVIVLCWLCSVIFFTTMFSNNMEHPGRFNACAGDCKLNFPFIGGIVHLFLDLVFPVSIIVVLYVRVFVVAVSQGRAMRSHVTVVMIHVSQKVNRSELKAARALGVVVVVFLMCSIPFFIVAISARFSDMSGPYLTFALCVVLLNSLLNPVIYVFMYPWFRNSVKCILSLQILKSGSSEANILEKLHTPTNFLLLSLAVSDFSVGFLWIFQILLLDGCWFISAGWCVFNAVLTSILSSASIGTVVLISVDRYVAVCDPMHYSTKVTLNRAKTGIVLCWLCYIMFYTALLKDNIEHPGRFNSCAGDCAVYIPFIAGIVHLFLDFIFPVSIIVVLYVRVFVVAVSQGRAMRSHVTVLKLHVSQKVNRSELKAARALGVVVVVFLMCLTPFFIVLISAGFPDMNATSFAFSLCLILFNSLLNPVIYVFMYPWFRKSVKCILSLQILKSGSSEANIL